MALTDAQIDCLRGKPQPASIIEVFKGYGWKASTTAECRAIFEHWATFPAFKDEHKTLADYAAKNGCGSGGTTKPTDPPPAPGTPGTGSSGDTLAKIMDWAKANPIPAAVVGFVAYSILLGRR